MPLIQLHANDNVLIAKRPLSLGEAVPAWALKTKAQVPRGTKLHRVR